MAQRPIGEEFEQLWDAERERRWNAREKFRAKLRHVAQIKRMQEGAWGTFAADTSLLSAPPKPTRWQRVKGFVGTQWNKIKLMAAARNATYLPSAGGAQQPSTKQQRSTRPAATKTGAQGTFRNAGAARPRGHLPLSISPPKMNQPGASPANRLGIGGSRSNAGRGGGLFATHGRSGTGDIGSYKVRAGTAMARNLKSRLGLSMSGWIAIAAGGARKAEFEAMNKSIVDAGVPGGFLALSTDEKIQAQSGGLYLKPLTKTANVLSRSAGNVAEILLGVEQIGSDVGLVVARAFGLPREKEKLVQAKLDSFYATGYDRLNTLTTEGWQALREWEDPQTIVYRESIAARNKYDKDMEAGYNDFIRRTANEIAGEVVGVSGADISDGIRSNFIDEGEYARWKQSVHDQFYKNNKGTKDAIERGFGVKE